MGSSSSLFLAIIFGFCLNLNRVAKYLVFWQLVFSFNFRKDLDWLPWFFPGTIGQCGQCQVIVDEHAVKGCMTKISQGLEAESLFGLVRTCLLWASYVPLNIFEEHVEYIAPFWHSPTSTYPNSLLFLLSLRFPLPPPIAQSAMLMFLLSVVAPLDSLLLSSLANLESKYVWLLSFVTLTLPLLKNLTLY